MIWAGLYVASLVVSAFGAWAISRHGDKVGLVDCPNGRSSHCMPTPKGGGNRVELSAKLRMLIQLGLMAREYGLLWVMAVLAGCIPC